MEQMKINVDITCYICGEVSTFSVTAEQLRRYYDRKGSLKDIFPELNQEERNMFITTICPKCMTDLYGDEETEHETIINNTGNENNEL